MTSPCTVPTDLIALLDALILRDPGPAGFTGALAVGIRGPKGYRWWQGYFGASIRTRRGLARPRDVQAILYLAQSDAAHILSSGTVPPRPELLSIEGDRKLIERFVERYTSRTSWVGIRLARGHS
jgi:hypothetical protein